MASLAEFRFDLPVLSPSPEEDVTESTSSPALVETAAALETHTPPVDQVIVDLREALARERRRSACACQWLFAVRYSHQTASHRHTTQILRLAVQELTKTDGEPYRPSPVLCGRRAR